MAKNILNVAVFTGSRAEYGLMRYLISAIEESSNFNLQLIVGGAHLSKKHGMTVREIEEDQIQPAATIPVGLDQDPQPSMAILTAETIAGVSGAIKRLKPDLLIVLGDRYETYGAASAAHLHRIPICHLHGGETTEGAIDDRLRHAISQLSTWHFCSADPYRERIIAMGHHHNHVVVSGPMVLDALIHEKKLSQKEFESQTGFKFGKTNLIATFHPETLKNDYGIGDLKILLEMIEISNTNILFTLPNADEGHEKISEALKEFRKKLPKRVTITPSLGQKRYLSSLFLFDGMIGNSSSGIIEAPLAGLPVLNIGSRQKGRLRFGNVIEGHSENDGIKKGFGELLSVIKNIPRKKETNFVKSSPTSCIMDWLQDRI
tara:strand:- start:1198 stop:2322 length:1125 start_codon:yes stop_codon:yes gene_type:complete